MLLYGMVRYNDDIIVTSLQLELQLLFMLDREEFQCKSRIALK